MKTDRSFELKQALLNKYHSAVDSAADTDGKGGFVDLTADQSSNDKLNKAMYDNSQSVEIYRNFLNWLFATFDIAEMDFRRDCFERLGNITGKKILITSCGLGEDIKVAAILVGKDGFVHAQDLSRHFISLAADKYSAENIVLTVSNALELPYKDGYFDAVFHFGGINLFGDIRLAISEMNRVCKIGGTILFGDESVAEHLRADDYGKMFMENNALWQEKVPLEHLPLCASDISLSYVLGNCFYLIKFTKSAQLPYADIDIEHVGYRGGSVRKRYFGKIEGIAPDLKNSLYELAKKEGKSVSKIIEELIKTRL
jgi:ubiquinone/menaquinone biosynthesis C-methylase UbiE